MSDEQKEMKVTDKRMFTPDGELREEYRFLEGKTTPAEGGSAPAAAESPQPPRPEPSGPAAPSPQELEESAGGARLELPSMPPGMGPTFFDLVALLAEQAALYLGDLALPDGETAENLEMARLHVDLLDVLRLKTSGNLSVQEASYLEDLLYRLRVRYVQKSR